MWLGLVVALIVGLWGGYSYGTKVGYGAGDKAGYKRAEADIKKIQEVSSQRAVDEAAIAANPFQAANPLEGVETNPFEKIKGILNPFQ